jgi:hypothetical protein
MSKLIGDRLPKEVLEAFDGQDLERKIGPAYLLLTSDEDGTPRPCMLSAGEILAADDKHLRVILWPGSHTSENLARGGPVTFCYVAPRQVIYAKGRSRALGPAEGMRLERFEIAVESVESDNHKGMPVTETITFTVEGQDPRAVAESWTKQIDALRTG